jgi:SAM-dependent methyltransferase
MTLTCSPQVFFYDVGAGLDFDDLQFDAVFSQVALHYVGNKAATLEEVWRVLKVGGRAFLHIDTSVCGVQPDFTMLHHDTPRFVVYDGKDLYPTAHIFGKLRRQGFDISLQFMRESRNIAVTMFKNSSRRIDLGLIYEGDSALDLTRMRSGNASKTDVDVWWGTRSVFQRAHGTLV